MSVFEKNTTYTKLFVGGLPYHTTDDSLREHFAVFGAIDEAVVIVDRNTGKSKGFGFVTMTDRTAAERACKDPNPTIDGRRANVNLAYLGAKPRIGQATVGGLRQIPQGYISAGTFTGAPPTVFGNHPPPTAAAYVTPSGVLIPASCVQPAPQVYNYSGGVYTSLPHDVYAPPTAGLPASFGIPTATFQPVTLPEDRTYGVAPIHTSIPIQYGSCAPNAFPSLIS